MESILKLITPKFVKTIWVILLIYAFLAMAKTGVGIFLIIITAEKYITAAQISGTCFAFFLDLCIFVLKCILLFSFRPSKISHFVNQFIKKEEGK